MSQTPGVTATGTPQDVTAGLAPGCYVAQVKGPPAVFYCTSPAAPERTDEAFGRDLVRGGERRDIHLPHRTGPASGLGDHVAMAGVACGLRHCHRADERMTGSESAIPGGALDGKARSTASTLTAAELAAALACEARVAERLLAAASTMTEKYAPAAPPEILNEAVIRVAGWLLEAPSSGLRMETVGPVTSGWSAAMTGALRASGAMGLLSPWKVRRAGAICG